VSAGSQRSRLTAHDWVRAALTAMAEGGLEAVAVEPLAARLGATKGSFYWHFENRQALLEAALAAWEREETEAVIEAVDLLDEPQERLDVLIGMVLDASPHEAIELALLASWREPAVAAALGRVSERRVDYVAGLYRAVGLDEDTARSQAVTAVAAYLGHVQLARTAPGALPAGRRWAQHRERVGRLLAPGADQPDR
jgi:AcrR family transcriptional regulator